MQTLAAGGFTEDESSAVAGSSNEILNNDGRKVSQKHNQSTASISIIIPLAASAFISHTRNLIAALCR